MQVLNIYSFAGGSNALGIESGLLLVVDGCAIKGMKVLVLEHQPDMPMMAEVSLRLPCVIESVDADRFAALSAKYADESRGRSARQSAEDWFGREDWSGVAPCAPTAAPAGPQATPAHASATPAAAPATALAPSAAEPLTVALQPLTVEEAGEQLCCPDGTPHEFWRTVDSLKRTDYARCVKCGTFV